jgi:PAS domain S-box-containing protein
MQSVDPPPHMFPPVCGEISEKFSSYESELQNLLRTLTGTSVLDLLVGCLKSLPFPLVVMEMTVERQWFPITTVNSAFEELSGFSEQDVKGLTIHSFVNDCYKHEDLLSLIRSEMLRAERSKAILPLNRKDGVTMICAVGVIPLISSNNTINSFLVLFDDISSPNYCMTRLKIFSDLLDSISPHLDQLPSTACAGDSGLLI